MKLLMKNHKKLALYDKGTPKIKEYLDLYGWHNADFDPDKYKKIDDWLE